MRYLSDQANGGGAWRLGGRYRHLDMLRRALLPLILILFAASPAAASAATRFVAPGAPNEGGCTQAVPCGIKFAVEHAAATDDVSVASGVYNVSETLNVPAGVAVHGRDGDLPLLVGTSTAPLITAADGSSLRFLRVVQRSGSRVLDSSGVHAAGVTLEDLFLERAGSSDGGPLVTLGNGDVLRDSVVWTRASSGRALGVQMGAADGTGGTPTADLRNVTVWTPAPGSTGIAALNGALTVRNTIVRSGGSDLLAFAQAPNTATITIDHSNYRPSAAAGAVVNAGANQSADPRLIDPDDGNFRALPGPAVDSGVDSGDIGTNDLDGYARVTGPRPDMGAYERPLPLSSTASTPTGLGATRATLQGSFDSHGRPASAYFQFGGDDHYGLRTTSRPFAGSSALSAAVTELDPDTTYHFRLIVVSDGVATAGGDRSFRTARACVVPSLGGQTLSQARRSLSRARCGLGHVSRPRRVPRGYTLVVSSQRPDRDAIRSVNSRVNLTLAPHRNRR